MVPEVAWAVEACPSLGLQADFGVLVLVAIAAVQIALVAVPVVGSRQVAYFAVDLPSHCQAPVVEPSLQK